MNLFHFADETDLLAKFIMFDESPILDEIDRINKLPDTHEGERIAHYMDIECISGLGSSRFEVQYGGYKSHTKYRMRHYYQRSNLNTGFYLVSSTVEVVPPPEDSYCQEDYEDEEEF